ncbi:MAG: 23S rRNA (adenine(2503)-C(2))-methyltransferase RlmN [Mariprofundaceae bacterium]|nr:23S rRNA (adenine(2503)-C(2))-methyltransferase RlmN [Mariprofundaceae bacterium]
MQTDTPDSPAPALIGMEHADLVNLCLRAGAKQVHADRLNAWVFRHGVTDIHAIPGLPQNLYDYLGTHAGQLKPDCIDSRVAEDGTRKMLLRMADGKEIETVLIPGPGRLTQCISTQVGCAAGCRFCLTATAGLTRNLSAAEMVSQVMLAREISKQEIRNLVLMGMGEPLHNYDQVARFVRIVTDPMGFAFSPRRVTLSTSGLVPAIYRMIEDALPCNLAVSLNATTDKIRSSIMPINARYPIAELMRAVRDYIGAKGRKRVLIEYVMLKGVNDSIDDAERLCELLDGSGCTVNLLPFNPFPGSAYQRPDDVTVAEFHARLSAAGLVAVVRESKGDEISAACGQLKTEVAEQRKRASAA